LLTVYGLGYFNQITQVALNLLSWEVVAPGERTATHGPETLPCRKSPSPSRTPRMSQYPFFESYRIQSVRVALAQFSSIWRNTPPQQSRVVPKPCVAHAVPESQGTGAGIVCSGFLISRTPRRAQLLIWAKDKRQAYIHLQERSIHFLK
jgi:hypothetical protein